MTYRYRIKGGLATLLIAILVVSQTAVIASAAPTISTDDRAVVNDLTTTSSVADISDDCSSAALVDATGAQNGTMDSGEDTDAFKISLEEGDHIDLDANAAIQEEDFEMRISVVNDGRFSVKNVSNAAGGATETTVERIDEINGGITASLEVWAETDTTLCFRISDNDDADTPYNWNITTDAKPGQTPDNYPDSDSEASVVSPNSTQTGTLGTPGDVDRFKVQLSEGDRVNMNALASVAEDDFEITVESVNDGQFSIKNVSNADGAATAESFQSIDQIEGGIPADWEVWAETDGTFIITVDDRRDATVPYEWSVSMNKDTPPPSDDYPDSEDNVPVVSPNSTQNGVIGTPDDLDRFKILLSKGDRVKIDAIAPEAEDDFEITVESVNDGQFSIKNVSNADGATTADTFQSIDQIEGGIPADWEVWAETDGAFIITVNDRRDATVPYEWSVSMNKDTPSPSDDYPDSEDSAPVVSPNSTQNGVIGTPDDLDRFKILLSKGDRVNMDAVAPVAEDDFEISVESVNDGQFSIKNVSNADGATTADTFQSIDQIEGGIPANWEIQAETDGAFIITVNDRRDATVPYEWQIRMQRNAPLTDQSSPTAAFSVTTQDLTTGTQITFDASGSSDGSVRSYDWDFNRDGEPESTGERTTRSFDSPGQYDVNLTVTDNNGVTDSVTKTITISEPAQDITVSVDAGPDGKIEIGEEVQFEAEPAGVPDDVTVNRYVWDFGNYSEENDTNARYTFVQSGTYTVSVTMLSDDGSRYKSQYNGTTNVTVEPTFADVPPLGNGFSTQNSDVRRIALSEGQSIGLAGTGNVDVSGEVLLYDSNGSLIQSEVVAGRGNLFGTTVQQNGTYYVAVNNLRNSPRTGVGTTRVTPYIYDSESFEPNQNQSTATRLESGDTVTGLTLTDNDPVDWYAVTVDGPAVINASSRVMLPDTNQASAGHLGLQIYDAAGNPVGEIGRELPTTAPDYNYNESTFELTPYLSPEQQARVSQAGTYYIRAKGLENVRSESFNGVTEYNLTVTTSRTDTADEPDFQVTGVTAPSSASVGSPITYTAEVTNTGDQQGTQNVTANFAGEEVGSRAITLDAGETRTLAFTTAADTPGPRSAAVSTDDDVEQATVEVVGQEFISGQSTGDPHITTFGGASYEFMAAGDFVLAREPQGDLLVVARQVPVGDSVSNNNATATIVGDSTVIIRAESSTPVSVDGQPVSVDSGESVAVADGAGKITRQGNTYTVYYAGDDGQATTSDEHLTANIVGDRLDLELSLHPDRANAVEGLLGDTDSDAGDDIAFNNGTALDRPLDSGKLYGAFRSDWRATGDENLFAEDYYVDTFPEETVTVDDLSEEERTRAEEALADSCLTPGTPQYRDALLDVALTDDSSYIASACQVDRDNIIDATEATAPSNPSEPGIHLELPTKTRNGNVVFAGYLVSNEGEGIADETVTIYDKDGPLDDLDGDPNKVTEATTDKNGRFEVEWSPRQFGGSDDVEVFAEYAGSEMYEPHTTLEENPYLIQVNPNLRPFDYKVRVVPSTDTVTQGTPARYHIVVYVPNGFESDPPKDMPEVSLEVKGLEEDQYSLSQSSQNLLYTVPLTLGTVRGNAYISTLTIETEQLNTGNHTFKIRGHTKSGDIVRESGDSVEVVSNSKDGARTIAYQSLSTKIRPGWWLDQSMIPVIAQTGIEDPVRYSLETSKGMIEDALNGEITAGLKPLIEIGINRVLPLLNSVDRAQTGALLSESANRANVNPTQLSQSVKSIPDDLEDGNEQQARGKIRYALDDVRRWRAELEDMEVAEDKEGSKRIALSQLEALEEFLEGESERLGMTDEPRQEIPLSPSASTPGMSTGDPHLSTFDGVGYDFQAAGEFVLARDTDGSPRIQARFQPVSDRDVSQTTAVATELDGQQITIDARDEQMLTVNGTTQTLEIGESLTVGDGEIFRTPQKYIVVYPGEDDEVNDGDSRLEATIFDDRMDVVVKPNRNAVDSMSGLLGSPDGSAENDLARADGTTLSTSPSFDALYGQYRDDWRVTADTSLFDYDDGESTAGFYDPDYPSEQVTIDDLPAGEREEAIQIATNAGLEPGTTEFHDAVLDYALTGDRSYVASATLATSESNVTTDATPPETALTEPSLTVTTENRVISRNQSLSVSVAADHPNPGEATVLVSNGSSIVFEEDVPEAFTSEQEVTWNTTLDGQSVDDGVYTLGVVTTSESGVRNVTTQGLLIDNSAPSVSVETANTTVDSDVNSTEVTFSYNDTESGIDPDSVVITEDGTDVTGEAQINANNASYQLTGLEQSENRTIEIQVANNASVTSTQSVTITVADGFNVAQYDRNDDGQIGFDELRFALREFNNGAITFDQFRRVLQAFNTGAAV
ncbi:VWD domain-containing protein [Haloarcula brevis]|uniref:VWD domain-containing protein n=1 Tax=Haloarcula brevis TaxID=3111453 RepID=UPI00300F34CD